MTLAVFVTASNMGVQLSWESTCPASRGSGVRTPSPPPYGRLVKRLRHRPFTAVTRVRFPYRLPYGSLVQLVRTPPCHGGGQRFKSAMSRQYSSLAQLVERMTVNHDVAGSNPARGANKENHNDIEWFVRAGLRSRSILCRCLICWRGSMAEQLTCNQQVGGSSPFASSIYRGVMQWQQFRLIT